MKILLSPAKTQDFTPIDCKEEGTTPFFNTEAIEIMNVLKILNVSDIKKLMTVSDAIAEKTVTDYKRWGSSDSSSKLALYTYKGEVFKCLDVDSFNKAQLNRASESIRILSAVYGVVKPTDLVQPYRLEVKTSLSVAGKKSLYAFWKEKVTGFLRDNLSKGELVVNLTSGEYAKMIDFKKFTNVIEPQFKVRKNGELKTVAVWAKKARGLFTRFLISDNIKTVEQMKSFNAEGFYLFETSDKNLLFVKEV